MEDPTVTWDGDVPVVRLEPWPGPVADDDPDAGFKGEVASYSLQDPLRTLSALGRHLSLPVGPLVRYVLARWVTAGSETILRLGPSTLETMVAVVDEAEAVGTEAAKAAAFDTLAERLRWVSTGLTDPEGTYPAGGAGP